MRCRSVSDFAPWLVVLIFGSACGVLPRLEPEPAGGAGLVAQVRFESGISSDQAFGLQETRRRRLGASGIEIDTLLGFCSFRIDEPTKLDDLTLKATADDSGYNLSAVDFILKGKVLDATCPICENTGPHFQMDVTGQLLELTEMDPMDLHGRYVLELAGWDGHHPQAKVVGWAPLPSPTEAGRSTPPP